MYWPIASGYNVDDGLMLHATVPFPSVPTEMASPVCESSMTVDMNCAASPAADMYVMFDVISARCAESLQDGAAHEQQYAPCRTKRTHSMKALCGHDDQRAEVASACRLTLWIENQIRGHWERCSGSKTVETVAILST
jgi:hypothetical protein